MDGGDNGLSSGSFDNSKCSSGGIEYRNSGKCLSNSSSGSMEKCLSTLAAIVWKKYRWISIEKNINSSSDDVWV